MKYWMSYDFGHASAEKLEGPWILHKIEEDD